MFENYDIDTKVLVSCIDMDKTLVTVVKTDRNGTKYLRGLNVARDIYESDAHLIREIEKWGGAFNGVLNTRDIANDIVNDLRDYCNWCDRSEVKFNWYAVGDIISENIAQYYIFDRRMNINSINTKERKKRIRINCHDDDDPESVKGFDNLVEWRESRHKISNSRYAQKDSGY